MKMNAMYPLVESVVNRAMVRIAIYFFVCFSLSIWNEIKKNIERQLTYIGIGQVHRMGHNFYLSGEIQNYTLGWYSYKACLPSMKVTNREKED